VHAINTLLVWNPRQIVHEISWRLVPSPEDWPFPPEGVTYRGGGLPVEHLAFYAVGKAFRVPGFLATSFRREIASRFLARAAYGELTVIWKVHVDPRGEHSFEHRCRHVNYVKKATPAVGNEEEYLFAPYSPFRVRAVSNSSQNGHQECFCPAVTCCQFMICKHHTFLLCCRCITQATDHTTSLN
jgi:hypothetical protein